jgi:plastocyanin
MIVLGGVRCRSSKMLLGIAVVAAPCIWSFLAATRPNTLPPRPASLRALGASLGSTQRSDVPLARVEGVATIRGEEPAGDAVIYLVPGTAEDPAASVPPIDGLHRIDQRGLQFDPHVLVVPVGATVEFTNSDDVLHNIFVPRLETEGFDLGTWPRGETRRHTFHEPGVSVLLCNVHPDMEAFIVVVPTIHYALTVEDGSFAIEDVPPGTYTLFAWHERSHSYETTISATEGTQRVAIALSVVSRR